MLRCAHHVVRRSLSPLASSCLPRCALRHSARLPWPWRHSGAPAAACGPRRPPAASPCCSWSAPGLAQPLPGACPCPPWTARQQRRRPLERSWARHPSSCSSPPSKAPQQTRPPAPARTRFPAQAEGTAPRSATQATGEGRAARCRSVGPPPPLGGSRRALNVTPPARLPPSFLRSNAAFLVAQDSCALTCGRCASLCTGQCQCTDVPPGGGRLHAACMPAHSCCCCRAAMTAALPCLPLTADGKYNCAQQAGWGKCGETWMLSYCQTSCRRCSCDAGNNTVVAGSAGATPTAPPAGPHAPPPAAGGARSPAPVPPQPPPPPGPQAAPAAAPAAALAAAPPPGPASQNSLLQPLFSALGGQPAPGGAAAQCSPSAVLDFIR